MIDTSHRWYFICNVLLNSNLSFHDFWPTFNLNRYKMLMLAKGPAYFQILSCYFIDVSLATFCRVYLKLNKYKKQIRKGNSNAHLPPAYLTLEKARLCIVKFPNSLKLSYIWKCLNKIFFFVWNYFYRRRFNVQSLANVFVPNKVSVTNEDIYCLALMKSNVYILSFILSGHPFPASFEL